MLWITASSRPAKNPWVRALRESDDYDAQQLTALSPLPVMSEGPGAGQPRGAEGHLSPVRTR